MSLATPSVATLKKLFAVSSNRCAFPGCKAALVAGGLVTGEVCHINAQSAGGPRYDAGQTDADRHAVENLTAMCPPHHALIDTDLATHTVAALLKIKADHEAAATTKSALSDDDAIEFIIKIRMNVTASFNQSGGQTANQIVNLYPPAQPPPSGAPMPRWVDERALSQHHSILKSPSPAFIDVVLMANAPVTAGARLSPAQLTEAVMRSKADYGLGFPYFTDDLERHQWPGGTYLAKTVDLTPYVESWTAFSTGFFRLTRVPLEDLRDQSLGGKKPTEFLNWLIAVAMTGETLVFALRFMRRLKVTGAFDYEIQYHGMRDRVLRDMRNALQFNYQCNTSQITIKRTATLDEIEKDPTSEAIEAIKELVAMFHWDRVTDDVLRNWFKQLWARQL